MSDIDLSQRDIRAIILFHFKSGATGAKAHELICMAFGPGTVTKQTCYNWYQRFQLGEFCLEDQPREGRPSNFDNEILLQAIEADPMKTTRELGEDFGVSNATIQRHLHELGKVSKLGKWIPYELSPNHKAMRISVCQSLLTKKRTFDWLNSYLTGDEKWVLHHNVTRRTSWVDKGQPGIPTPKGPLVQKKVMVTVFWCMKGPLMIDFIPPNTTVNSDVYISQLDRLNQAIKKKLPEAKRVFFHHDNAPAHRSRKTSEKLISLGWEVVPHPPYSPDLASTDYYLFKTLQAFCREKRFKDDNELKVEVTKFFEEKEPNFYQRGIVCLPEKWKEVIANNGNYLLD